MKIIFFFIISFHLIYSEELAEQKNYHKIYKSLKLSLNQDPKIEKFLELANISLILDKKEESKRIYKNILSISKNNRNAIKNLAFLYAKEGNIEEAREVIKPLRKNFDPIVVYTEALIQMNLKNYKRAVYELEEAQKNGLDSLELNKFLIDSYTLSNQTTIANLKLNNLIQQHPIDANLFFKKAKNHLKIIHQLEKKIDKQREFEKVESALDACLLIDPFYVDARHLKSKIYILQDKLEESKEILESLILDFPNNTQYRYLQSFIDVRQSNFQQAKEQFIKILSINPNEFYARYKAEDISIRNLEPNSFFRLDLSQYRINQYYRNKSALLYELSDLQLERANQLTPDGLEIQKILMQRYKQKKDFDSFLKIFFLNRNPQKIDDQLLLKSTFTYIKDQLSYKEKLVNINNWSRIEKRYTPNRTTLLLFDPQSENILPNHPDISSILYNSFRDKIKKNHNFFLTSKEKRNQLLNQFQIEKKLYTQEYSFNKNMIDIFNHSDTKIHFFISSKIKKEMPLSLEFTIWNTEKEKIKSFFITRNGKNSIEKISLFLNNALNESLPKTTKIIKVKNNSLIVNLGKKNKLKKDDLVDIIDENKMIWKAKVIQSDFYNSEVIPEKWNWRNFIAVGNKVIYTKKND